MLKIKDEIPLSELEKFGFEDKSVCYSKYVEQINYNDTHYSYTESNTFIVVNKYSRDIWIGRQCKLKNTEESKDCIVANGVFEVVRDLDIVYDLIQEGLIEKLEK